MTTYFIADPQFGHLVTSQHRGFATVEAHDAAIMRNWRRHVTDRDDVFVVGDAVMGGWKDGLALFRDLPGVKHLVLGNHDRPHPRNRNGHRYVRAYMEVFESVAMAASVRHEGREYVLSHYPYNGDHTPEERDLQWRLRDEGAVLIHGHTHSADRVTYSAAGTLQVCVCVDAWNLSPVSIRQVADLVAAELGLRSLPGPPPRARSAGRPGGSMSVRDGRTTSSSCRFFPALAVRVRQGVRRHMDSALF